MREPIEIEKEINQITAKFQKGELSKKELIDKQIVLFKEVIDNPKCSKKEKNQARMALKLFKTTRRFL